MHDKNELCDKIKSIYPDIGECGIDVEVNYNESKKAWVVDLKHGGCGCLYRGDRVFVPGNTDSPACR